MDLILELDNIYIYITRFLLQNCQLQYCHYLFISRIAFVDAISVLKKGAHHDLCLLGTTGWIFLFPGWKIFSTLPLGATQAELTSLLRLRRMSTASAILASPNPSTLSQASYWHPLPSLLTWFTFFCVSPQSICTGGCQPTASQSGCPDSPQSAWSQSHSSGCCAGCISPGGDATM